MNSFKLFIESVNLETKPELQNHLPEAKKALETYLKRYGGLELDSSSTRYNFKLTKYNNGYWAYDTYTFEYTTIDKNRPNTIIDDKKIYKTPKDAIDDIPKDNNLAYRGMSWEEWQNIKKTGLIQSKGTHNFISQQSLTFYGPDPDTGTYYASGFAPMAFKPTPTRPGVVIAIPRHLLKTNKENKNIPANELAHEGPLESNKIVNAWMIVTTKVKPGKFELLVHKNGKVEEGSRFDISISYAIRKFI